MRVVSVGHVAVLVVPAVVLYFSSLRTDPNQTAKYNERIDLAAFSVAMIHPAVRRKIYFFN